MKNYLFYFCKLLAILAASACIGYFLFPAWWCVLLFAALPAVLYFALIRLDVPKGPDHRDPMAGMFDVLGKKLFISRRYFAERNCKYESDSIKNRASL